MTDSQQKNDQLTFELNDTRLAPYYQKPKLFTPGEVLFWDDQHISEQVLAVHLDPETELASRKPETIEASVAWIVEQLGLEAGDAVLDLGCGPGLYAVQLARRGLAVSGVDISHTSIAYAHSFVAEQKLRINYRCQDYLTITDEKKFDVVLLIYGDYCTFNPEDRQRLLGVVGRALRPGGHFVLDVSTRVHREKYGLKKSLYPSKGGFWRPGPHLVIEHGFDYPKDGIWLDQYIIVEESGSLRVYRNWFQDYDREGITAELTAGSFDVQSVWGDLTGKPYCEDGEWIGVVAKWVSD